MLLELENIDDECDLFGIQMVKIQDPQMAKRYGIKTFPAVVYFRNGNPLLYEGKVQLSPEQPPLLAFTFGAFDLVFGSNFGCAVFIGFLECLVALSSVVDNSNIKVDAIGNGRTSSRRNMANFSRERKFIRCRRDELRDIQSMKSP